MNEFERRRVRGSHKPAKSDKPSKAVPAAEKASSAGAPRPQPGHGKRGGFSRFLRSRRGRIALLVAGAVLVLAIVGLLLFFFLGGRTSAPEESGIPSDISRSENSTDLAYDKDADRIDESKYDQTILAESEDAGQEYIDETLFIGDSNTYRMISYGFTSLENDIGVVSMGIQMVTTKPCVYFKGYANPVTIPEAVKIMQPRRIIMTFGTNNTIGWSTETFIDSYRTALEAIHDAYPYADIIINSIPPVHQYRDNPDITMQTIDKFNLGLVELAEEMGFKFLNTAEELKDEKTGFAQWEYTISDGIHLKKDAFEAMFNYIRTHSYITEDDRPMPLKAIPERKETPPDLITSDPLSVHTAKPDSSSTPASVRVLFGVNNAKAGYIEGSAEQTVAPGGLCVEVIARANQGYEFVKWEISSGSIPHPTEPKLAFTAPADASGEIRLTAVFRAKATPTPTRHRHRRRQHRPRRRQCRPRRRQHRRQRRQHRLRRRRHRPRHRQRRPPHRRHRHRRRRRRR